MIHFPSCTHCDGPKLLSTWREGADDDDEHLSWPLEWRHGWVGWVLLKPFLQAKCLYSLLVNWHRVGGGLGRGWGTPLI